MIRIKMAPASRDISRRTSSSQFPTQTSESHSTPQPTSTPLVPSTTPSTSSFRLYPASEVPESVREFNILSGYRQPGCGVAACLRSVFSPCNETLNFWTHFLPLCYATWQALHVARHVTVWRSTGDADDDEGWNYAELPLPIYCAAVFGLLGCSSLAHLFNSATLKARQVFFFIDYAGISLYGAFATISYFFLIRPRHFLHKSLFIWGANLVAVLCCFTCCLTRKFNFPRSLKSVVRASVTAVPFVLGSTPAFVALYDVCHLRCANSVVDALNATGQEMDDSWKGSGFLPSFFDLISDWPTFTNESANQDVSFCCDVQSEANEYFVSHSRWFLMAVIMFTSKIPERFFPGKFDVLGHSHQLFHICIAMGAYKQYQMLLTYFRGQQRLSSWEGPSTEYLGGTRLATDGSNTAADMSTTLASMAFVVFFLVVTIVAFSACVDPEDGRCHSLTCCWHPFPEKTNNEIPQKIGRQEKKLL